MPYWDVATILKALFMHEGDCHSLPCVGSEGVLTWGWDFGDKARQVHCVLKNWITFVCSVHLYTVILPNLFYCHFILSAKIHRKYSWLNSTMVQSGLNINLLCHLGFLSVLFSPKNMVLNHLMLHLLSNSAQMFVVTFPGLLLYLHCHSKICKSSLSMIFFLFHVLKSNLFFF